jgi:uncharacterized protein YggE
MSAFRFVRMSALCAVIAVAAGEARAQQPPILQQAESLARIVVTGNGNIALAPDYAEFGCGASTKAKTAKEATNANSKIVAAIMAALRDSGVEQKDIQTAQFSLQPDYAASQPNTEPKLIGFSVSNRVSVTVRDIGKLGDIIDRVVAAGATDVGQVDFAHNDVSKLLDQARGAALADARRKAEIYAKAAGLTLGTVVYVRDNGERLPFAQKSFMRVAAAAVPIAAGEDTLGTSVTVGFDVVPK